MASLVGVQSPQCKDRHHRTEVIYAGAERISPCPGPPGKHLAIYKYSAYFSNYSFSKVPLFFLRRTENDYKLGPGREELNLRAACLPQMKLESSLSR